MIRNVSIHVEGEQPLLADLYDVPTAADAGLLCTNVRMTDGKRPVFIDRIEATFFFPYHVVRFIEIPVGAMDTHVPTTWGKGAATASPPAGTVGGQPELRLPVPLGGADLEPSDADVELEIDEGFLQRIRDI